MFWNKRKVDTAQIEIAEASAAETDKIIAQLDSQEEEVQEIITRLEKREERNNFGEALVIAMGRRV